MFKRRKKYVPENIYEDEMDKMGRKALLYMKLHGIDDVGFGLCDKCKSLFDDGRNNFCVRMSKGMELLQYDALHNKVVWTKLMVRGAICIEWVKYV